MAAVRNLGGEVAPVALVEEAWHVGLHHQGLAGDEVDVHAPMLHVLGVGDAFHVPQGQEVGSGKRKGSLSLLVGIQGGEEEGGVDEVAAEVGIFRRVCWLG